jgi:hypothetical protein
MSDFLQCRRACSSCTGFAVRQELAGGQFRINTRDALASAVAHGVQMSVCDVIAKIVSYLCVGYPEGEPATGTIPLLALLRRRLSDAEAAQMATELGRNGNLPFDATNVRVMITRVTDLLPAPDEVERVKKHLEIHGCTISDEFPPPRSR